MAYDERLAERIRAVLEGEPGLTERKMFGGLGFMLDGHMAVAAGSQGAMMLRVDPTVGADLVDGVHVTPMEMRGRTMTGWLLLDATAVASDADLARFVAIGAAYVQGLPPK